MDVYEETAEFYERFTGMKRVYGKSAEGRELFALFVGKQESPVGISQYAIHGREYVTAWLAFHHVRVGVRRGGVWILPLANPDGALLSQVGLAAAEEERRGTLIRINGGSDDFSQWKANAEGVDLNVNFDAHWGTGKQNVFAPAPGNFVGPAPFSAPETAALRAFTERVRPDFTVSWHTKGEEIYWQFRQPPLRALRDGRLARILQTATGYPLREARGSAGGYKDWCVEKIKIPAFTVEVGSDRLAHPLGREALGGIIQRNGDALRALTEGF